MFLQKKNVYFYFYIWSVCSHMAYIVYYLPLKTFFFFFYQEKPCVNCCYHPCTSLVCSHSLLQFLFSPLICGSLCLWPVSLGYWSLCVHNIALCSLLLAFQQCSESQLAGGGHVLLHESRFPLVLKALFLFFPFFCSSH